MKAVWKFPIEMTDKSSIMMPVGAEILRFGLQDGEPFIWALVNTSAKTPKSRRWFRFAGTGHKITEQVQYIGTIDLPGPLVFHLFEIPTVQVV